MTKRPDHVTHSDETVLRIMRCESRAEVFATADELGISRGMAEGWFYRKQPRALRIADRHGLPPRERQARPAGVMSSSNERDLIRAILAGDA